MRVFGALLANCLRIEFRVRETVFLFLSLISMLVVIVALGVHAAVLEPTVKETLYPCLLWVVFLLSATAAVGRSFEYEGECGALDGLIMAGVPLTSIFLAKTGSNFIILFFGQCCAAFLLAIFLNVPLPSLAGVVPVFVTALLGYAALATLLSGIAVSAKLKQILLPIILLPLLFPIFLCAIELTYMARLEDAPAWGSPWFAFLLGLDVLYLVLGVNLFEFVVRE